jgi:hypothetical protein
MNRKEAHLRGSTALAVRDYFIGPISEARESVCYAVVVIAGRTGHITISLLALRVGPPVVMFDASVDRERTGTIVALDVKEQKLVSNRSVALGFLLVGGCECDGSFRGEQ